MKYSDPNTNKLGSKKAGECENWCLIPVHREEAGMIGPSSLSKCH